MSKILNNERSIWLYQPPEQNIVHNPQLLIFCDGWNYTTAIPTPTILDNLLADKSIEPVAALFIEHDLWEDRQSELACNDKFTSFLANEILPWYLQLTGYSTTPNKTTLVGSSLGGLAACYLALNRPDLFGNVLAQSCAVMWGNNRIIREFDTKERQEIRLYLDMGSQEYCHTAQQYSTEIMSQFLIVLDQKDYEYIYHEYNGGHDYLCWAASLSDGLKAISTAK
jgi:enterochelin esterase family protein